ncbi:MAG: YlxR family protein [Candidatus Gastranaerophilaceae bacterium]
MSRKDKFKRKCVACGKFSLKSDLNKITYCNGEFFVNPESATNGRSAYVHKNEECVKDAFWKNRVEGSFKKKIDKNVKEQIFSVLKK